LGQGAFRIAVTEAYGRQCAITNRKVLVPLEGRTAIVTDAGRDAVDADVPLTNGTEADGEVVWS
jgi:hypothetical protein